MPNRSLDDFVGGSEAESSDSETDIAEDAAPEPDAAADATESDAAAAETDAEETAAEADDGTEPTLTVEEATPTYDFSPDGSTCEACGETVQTRWHDADRGMVCADCKRWD